MGYLQEICLQVENQNYEGFAHLWGEYVKSDIIDEKELSEILVFIGKSVDKSFFGEYIELALEAWEKLAEGEGKDSILSLIVDLQTTNSPKLAEIVENYLEKHYKDKPLFKEKVRLVGLRGKGNFQGAIRNFKLLNHIGKGKFVFHSGGWGVGEVVDVSLVREQLAVEFENVIGVKDVSFVNAFNNLTPISDEHFLARRFGNPDALEKEAKKDPVKILRLLLQDLGPKTAQEIKDAMMELVIPEDEWSKWWQAARIKAKKDTMIQTPTKVNGLFKLCEKELSHEERFKNFLAEVDSHYVDKIIEKVYEFSRLFPGIFKNEEVRRVLREKLLSVLSLEDKTDAQVAQVYIFLEDFYKDHLDNALTKLVLESNDIERLVQDIGIASFKKRILAVVRKHREDWSSIFSYLLLSLPQHFLRDYLIKELEKPATKELLNTTIKKLVDHPTMYPAVFIWYCQKALETHNLPYADQDGILILFETLLILLYHLENNEEYRELVKKIHAMLSHGRYILVRDILNKSSLEYAQEILLLATKCQTFSRHDIKILISLARVAHPSIEDREADEEKERLNDEIFWATQEGYNQVQDKIRHIATVETVDNAKEIEAARALGDLRENSEYKFAQERRARLQAELKLLSDQIKVARVLTPQDVDKNEVGVGSRVTIVDSKGTNQSYIILGPWEADPDKSILSFQSQLARSMRGCRVGDSFEFRGETFTVDALKSFFE